MTRLERIRQLWRQLARVPAGTPAYEGLIREIRAEVDQYLRETPSQKRIAA